MYILQNIHWFLVFIGALVFFHELGHFLVAKWCDVKVLRFAIGFGPKLLGFTRGDTEYQIRILPLGGYVKMVGEVPGTEIPVEDVPRAFSSKPVWQRALIALAGPVFNFLLALVVYFFMFAGNHSVGDTRIGLVTPGEPAYIAGIRPGDRILSVRGEPVNNWDELRRAISDNPNEPLVLTYERNRQTLSTTVAPKSHDELNVFQEKEAKGRIGISLNYLKPIMAVLDKDSPAAKAGLKTGDLLAKVNGQIISAWHDVEQLLQNIPAGTFLQIQVLRGQVAVDVTLNTTAWPETLKELQTLAPEYQSYSGIHNKDTLIAAITTDTPAQKAGLQLGDRLLRISGITKDQKPFSRNISAWAVDLASLETLDISQNIEFLLQRENQLVTLSFKLTETTEKNDLKQKEQKLVFGAVNDESLLESYTKIERYGLAEAATRATAQVTEDMKLVALGIAKMFQGRVPLDSMGGPIMLFVLAEKSAKRGADFFLRMMAVISVNLGMLNLLPLPVLDGGHLLFFAIESIRRRPLSLRVREVANVVGMALLLLLMVYVIRNDVLRYVLGS